MSYGTLTHFRPESVGPEIPSRCTDGCPIAKDCPYYAPRIYIERNPGFWARDPASTWRPALFGRLYHYLPRQVPDSPVSQRFFGQRLEETANPLYSHLGRFSNTARSSVWRTDESKSTTKPTRGW